MTPEAQKTFNTFMGALLLFLSCICFGLAGYMIFVPAATTPAPPPTIATVPLQPCIEGLKALKLSPTQNGDDIQAMDTDSAAAPLDRLKNASLGISMCHLYLAEFCLGPSCPSSNAMTFRLSSKVPGSSPGFSVIKPAPPLVAK